MSDPIGKIISITWWRQVFQKTGKAFGWGCAAVFAVPLAMVGINNWNGRGNQNTGAMSKDAQLMTVNGDPVSMGDYYAVASSSQMGAPGEDYANQAGHIVKELVQQDVIAQEATREGVKASDADIDKSIQDLKVQRLGKNATDADLENLLYQARHISLADYRAQLAKGMLAPALVDAQKKKTVVTEEEARNQSADVRLNVVLIPTVPTTPLPGMPSDPRAQPDAAAQKKAEALLAEVKSGTAAIAKIAIANSSDYTNKKGGDTGFLPEYKSSGMPDSLGVLGFGKDFDTAVHAVKAGGFTGVVKATGFRSGYLFAKVAERRNNLPKDFAPAKVVDQLKQQRAQEVVIKKVEDLTKTAKIVFPSDRIEQKAYYDYFLLSEMDQGSAFGSPSTATPEQRNAQKALVDSEIQAVYKKDPTNTTAAILVLDAVKLKMSDPKLPLTEQTQLREQLLPLYQNIIKATEGTDYAYRFGLADALRDKKQFAEAYKNYHSIGRSLDYDTPTELKSMQDAVRIRQRLAMALKSVASPEAPLADAEATAQAIKVQELNGQIAQLQFKQQLEQKQQQQLQQEMQKKQAEQLKSQTPKAGGGASVATPEGFGKSLNIAPGAGKSVTVPASGAQPTAAPKTPPAGALAPTKAAPTTPPAGGTGR
jgi:hypothetical protein